MFFKKKLAFLIFILASFNFFAAPHLNEKFTYRQPDGSSFSVYLTGDEFFVYQRTKEGYEVVKDSNTKFWCFAKLNEQSDAFVSTGVAVVSKEKTSDSIPPSLKSVCVKNQELPLSVIRQIVRKRQESLGLDSKGRYVKPGETRAPPSRETVGKFLGLCLLVDFPDEVGTIPASDIDDFCNKPSGYTDYGNACSVNEYYTIQSNGKLNYNCIVTAYIRMSEPKDYYDDGESVFDGAVGAKKLINEALALLNESGFDFSGLSVDENGYVYSLNIFYAGTANGYTTGQKTGLWPHFSGGIGFSPTTGIVFDRYQVSPMGSSLKIGTFCHENGHMLCDYPDLYSYDGNSAKTAYFSLMGWGNNGGGGLHPTSIDPYLKVGSGWADVVDLDSTTSLDGLVQTDKNRFYRYKNPNDAKQYYLLECRSATGYEGVYGGASTAVNPATGLVIWQIDEDGNNMQSTIFKTADPVDYSVPFEALVIESNPTSTYSPWVLAPNPGSDDGFLNQNGTIFSNNTSQPANFWSATGYDVSSNFLVRDVSTLLVSNSSVSFGVGSSGSIPVATPAVTKDVIDLFAPEGGTVDDYSMTVFNSGSGTLNYTVNESSDWLSLDKTSGTIALGGTDSLLLSFDITGMTVGEYSTTVTLSSPSTSTQTTFIVNMTIDPSAGMVVNLTEFTQVTFWEDRYDMAFLISNSGAGSFSYEVTDTSPYINLSRTSGTVTGESDVVYISLDASAENQETISATIQVKNLETDEVTNVSVDYKILENSLGITFGVLEKEYYQIYEKIPLSWQTELGGTTEISLIKSDSVDPVQIIEDAVVNSSSNIYNWYISNTISPGDRFRVCLKLSDGSTSYSEPFSIGPRRSYFVEEEGGTSGYSLVGATAQGYSADDQEYVYTLPFDFPFYGVNHSEIAISTNGYIYLDPTVSYEYFQGGYDYFLSNPTIAPYANDLVTFNGDIYVKEESGKVTISWVAYPFDVYDYDSDYSEVAVWENWKCGFSIVLYQTGVIEFHYANSFNVYITPLIGISAGDYERYDISEFSGADTMPSSIIWTPQYEVTLTSGIDPAKVLEDSDGQLFGSRTFMVKDGDNSGSFTALDVPSLYEFYAWSGDYVSETRTVNFEVNDHMTVRAEYEPVLTGYVVGMFVSQEGSTVTWSVELEEGIKEYHVVDSVTGKVYNIIESGRGRYVASVPEGVVAKIVVVDNNGFMQSFISNVDGSTTVYRLEKGWNLIALSGDNADLSELYASTTGVFWGWNGHHYELITTPEVGNAFWVYAPVAVEAIVEADRVETVLNLEPGWNMVGPTENMLIPTQAHAVYGWNQTYQNIIVEDGILLQGVGYWIFTFAETP